MPNDQNPFLLKLIYEDLLTQREGILAQGFWAIAAHRVMAKRLRFRSKFIRWPWKLINLLLGKIIQMMTGIEIPESATVGRRLKIEHFGGIIIHGSSIIGDDCVIRQGVTLGNRTDDQPNDAPTIGNRVKISAGAQIIGKITVGDDVIVGANAVVVTDIPSNCTAVGVPARIIRKAIV